MAGGIGEVAFCPVSGYMAENLPYSISQLVASLLYVVGGTLYALASEGWMVILGRVVIGCGGTFTVLVHTYIGEMGTKMDRVRRKKGKRSVKFVLYIFLSFILNGGYVLTFCELFEEC